MEVPNVSTVDWTREFIQKRFLSAIRKLRFKSRSHFFDEVGKTYVEQIEAGEELEWPLRFVTRKKPQAKKLKGAPKKKNSKQSRPPAKRPRKAGG
jgi:hypothetical protein